jgi:hypothetical protein
MLELGFQVVGALAVPHCAAPAVALSVEISSPVELKSLSLQTQVRIEAPARRYTTAEQEDLRELFGDPSRWTRTLTDLLWANVATPVAGFSGKTAVEVLLPVTFDFNVAAAKYFDAIDGVVPLRLMFSGTVFYAGGDGALQVALLPWRAEARFLFPAALWRRTLELYFPNTAPMHLDRGVFDRLRQFQVSRGLATVERALEVLLEGAS